MKLAFDYKRLHLRFLCGIGFALFIVKKAVKRKDPELKEAIKSVGKDLKRLLGKYKRENGALKLLEIESEDTRILIKL